MPHQNKQGQGQKFKSRDLSEKRSHRKRQSVRSAEEQEPESSRRSEGDEDVNSQEDECEKKEGQQQGDHFGLSSAEPASSTRRRRAYSNSPPAATSRPMNSGYGSAVKTVFWVKFLIRPSASSTSRRSFSRMPSGRRRAGQNRQGDVNGVAEKNTGKTLGDHAGNAGPFDGPRGELPGRAAPEVAAGDQNVARRDSPGKIRVNVFHAVAAQLGRVAHVGTAGRNDAVGIDMISEYMRTSLDHDCATSRG